MVWPDAGSDGHRHQTKPLTVSTFIVVLLISKSAQVVDSMSVKVLCILVNAYCINVPRVSSLSSNTLSVMPAKTNQVSGGKKGYLHGFKGLMRLFLAAICGLLCRVRLMLGG